eukprot:9316967-Lingulodinium_polyedra.AAC.1
MQWSTKGRCGGPRGAWRRGWCRRSGCGPGMGSAPWGAAVAAAAAEGEGPRRRRVPRMGRTPRATPRTRRRSAARA